MPEWLSAALVAAAASAATNWGMVHIELRWLRRDVDAAHERLDTLGAPSRFGAHRRKDHAPQ